MGSTWNSRRRFPSACTGPPNDTRHPRRFEPLFAQLAEHCRWESVEVQRGPTQVMSGSRRAWRGDSGTLSLRVQARRPLALAASREARSATAPYHHPAPERVPTLTRSSPIRCLSCLSYLFIVGQTHARERP